MKMKTLTAMAVSLVALGAAPSYAATLGVNAFAYALGNDGTSIVTVATPDNAAATSVDLDLTATGGTQIDALAYRPQTRQFYGYSNASATVVEVDVQTGATRAVVTEPGVTTSPDLGFDFNNVLDAARIVTADDQNVVFFPNNTPPTLEPKTELFYDDANAGTDPNVVMNAYTNAVPNPTATVQYAIDTDLNLLATLGNNAGNLTAVGKLMLDGMEFDLNEFGGLDILSFSEGDNTAYGLFTSGTTQAIYQLPLTADDFGNVNLSFVSSVTSDFGSLDGFAVAAGPAVAPVPVPATLPLLLAGLGAIGVARKRRKSA